MNETSATYLKAASALVAGDFICEPDGYTFVVKSIEPKGKRLVLTIEPVMGGPATPKGPRTCAVRSSSFMRAVRMVAQ